MARSKNRKRNETRLVFPAPLAGILALVSALALTYLWLNSRCDAIGMRIKALEREKEALHRKVVNEECKWSNMTSPANMQRLMEAHGLTMQWPARQNVIRLQRAVTVAQAAPAARQYAQHRGNQADD
jgi:hypothetical protein